MAGSRLHKVGTIFSRVTGLMRSGAMKEEDQPMWLDIYRAFPPKVEPRFDRPPPKVDIKKIFYPEDVIRAKFYKTYGTPAAINMSSEKAISVSQRFIETYYELERNGTTSEDLFDATTEVLRSQGISLINQKTEIQETLQEKYSVESELTTVQPSSKENDKS